MSGSDSVAFIKKVAGGDTSAMLDLYDGTSRLIFGFLSRALSDSAAAEEVQLEVYTCIWRQGKTYEPRGGTPLAWMMGIARASAIDRLHADQPKGSGSRAIPDDAFMSETRQQLSSSAIEVSPPEYVRDLLAARIEREPRPTQPLTPGLAQADKARPRHAEAPRPTPPIASRERASILPWMVAAVFALAAALGFFLWLQSQRRAELALQSQKDEANDAKAKARELQSLLDTEKTRTGELASLDAALASPGMNVIVLSSRRPGVGAAAAVFLDTNKMTWIILGHLPPAASGRAYQLWLVFPDGRRSAGLVPVDSSGHCFASFDPPPNQGRIISVEITAEADGGSQQPTSPPILAGKAG
jgi:DNA-directed RNA polymerase specialized sigma24 family protein